MVYSTMPELSVVVVGNSKCGKTQLINRFTGGKFSNEYSPTGFDRLETIKTIRGQKVKFIIWDTSGSLSYKQLRPLVYKECDVALICSEAIDSNNNTDQDDIKDWFTEIDVFNLLSVIVETKSDLIDPLNMTNTSTSSLLNTNVHDVFDLCYHKFSLGPKSQVINRPETLKLCSNPKYVVKRQSHVIVSSVKPSRLYRHSGYFNDNPRLIPVSIPLSPTSESTGSICSPVSSMMSPTPSSLFNFTSSNDVGSRVDSNNDYRPYKYIDKKTKCKVM